MRVKVPIVLITGEVGSGKTTLVRRILGATENCAAVLMREIEATAFDGRLAAGRSLPALGLADNCVYDTTAADLETAVERILASKQPEFLFLETTGGSQTHTLVQVVEDNMPQLRLDCVVCVVDAFLCSRQPGVGGVARARYEAADVVLLNKIDLITTEEIKSVEAQVRRINGSALLFKTVGCDIDMGLFFGLQTSRRPFRLSPHGEIGFQAFTYRSQAIFDQSQFLHFAAALPPSVFRARGLVRFVGETCLFNYVAGRTSLEPAVSENTELILIGRDIYEDRDAILRQLSGCEVAYAL